MTLSHQFLPVVVLDSDTTVGSSPYIENITLRSVYGMCGTIHDGDKVRGFKSMLFNQFTGIGLQKDNNAFIKFNETTGGFDDSTSVDNIHSDSKEKYGLITITSTSRAKQRLLSDCF